MALFFFASCERKVLKTRSFCRVMFPVHHRPVDLPFEGEGNNKTTFGKKEETERDTEKGEWVSARTCPAAAVHLVDVLCCALFV